MFNNYHSIFSILSIFSLESVPLLHDMDVAEYSEYEFNFGLPIQ